MTTPTLVNRGRGRAASALALSLALGFVGTGVAHASHFNVRVPAIDGCNEQPVGDSGLAIRWTSALKDRHYPFQRDSRSGALVTGHGAPLEINVQWSVVDAAGNPVDVKTAIEARGIFGFSPGAIEGDYINVVDPPAVSPGDATACGVDPTAGSYGIDTAYFEFKSLHQAGSRGRGIAKGTAHLEHGVDVGEPGSSVTAKFGTDLHVATGGGRPDDN